MTRAISITNLSNWDGEDYRVTSNQDMHRQPVTHKNGDPHDITLKPGQSLALHLYSGADTVTVEAVDREMSDGNNNSVPFMMNGQQVTPFIETGFR